MTPATTCPRCRYPAVTGTTICPECGLDRSRVSAPLRLWFHLARRRWWYAAAFMLSGLLVTLGVVDVVPYLPTSVLVRVLEFEDRRRDLFADRARREYIRRVVGLTAVPANARMILDERILRTLATNKLLVHRSAPNEIRVFDASQARTDAFPWLGDAEPTRLTLLTGSGINLDALVISSWDLPVGLPQYPFAPRVMEVPDEDFIAVLSRRDPVTGTLTERARMNFRVSSTSGELTIERVVLDKP
jgi:hypothetical protein